MTIEPFGAGAGLASVIVYSTSELGSGLPLLNTAVLLKHSAFGSGVGDGVLDTIGVGVLDGIGVGVLEGMGVGVLDGVGEGVLLGTGVGVELALTLQVFDQGLSINRHLSSAGIFTLEKITLFSLIR